MWLAELDLACAARVTRCASPSPRELSRYQAVERDFSFTFPTPHEWQAISSAIEALKIDELQQALAVAELWRNDRQISGLLFDILVRTVFQSHDRTLRDEELTGWSDAIIAALQALGGVLCAAYDVPGTSDDSASEYLDHVIHGSHSLYLRLGEHAWKPQTANITPDEFQALEQKVLRAVEVVRREREARAAAEAEVEGSAGAAGRACLPKPESHRPRSRR